MTKSLQRLHELLSGEQRARVANDRANRTSAAGRKVLGLPPLSSLPETKKP